ncbi:MAG: hypothetical protein MI861_05765, partial [Pirellulales bacterium]|nr:hypothetical protein [Pirellulales bacterium]
LLRQVARGGDTRIVVSKTELIDLPAIEMIDMVRRLEQGRNLPIVVYGAEVKGLAEQRWAAPTLQIDQPASTAAYAGVMSQIERMRRLPPLSPIDREIYRTMASQMLRELAQTR